MPLARIPRTASQAGLDARQIAARLHAMQKGDRVTYAELSTLIGKDVQARRDLLTTARNLARAEYGMVFDVETDIGLVCLDSPGIVGLTERKLERQYRTAGRIKRDLDCVNPDTLTALERYRWMAQQGIVVAVGLFTHPKTLTQHVEARSVPQLPFNPNDYKDLFK